MPIERTPAPGRARATCRRASAGLKETTAVGCAYHACQVCRHSCGRSRVGGTGGSTTHRLIPEEAPQNAGQPGFGALMRPIHILFANYEMGTKRLLNTTPNSISASLLTQAQKSSPGRSVLRRGYDLNWSCLGTAYSAASCSATRLISDARPVSFSSVVFSSSRVCTRRSSASSLPSILA